MTLFDTSDRRRLLVAGVTSIACLPFLLGGGGSPASSASVAAIGPVDVAGAIDAGADGAASGRALIESVDVDGDQGRLPHRSPPATKPTLVEVAVPVRASASAKLTHAPATGAARPCAIASIQIGMTIEVLNLHNGHKVRCTVVGAGGR